MSDLRRVAGQWVLSEMSGMTSRRLYDQRVPSIVAWAARR